MSGAPDEIATSDAIEHVAVVIPARDEADTIIATLEAVRVAASRLPDDITHSCVVVADGCRDDTVSIVRRWTVRLNASCTVVECSERSAGAARCLGTALVVADGARRGVTPDRLWLAHTDGDTSVSSDWLTQQLELAVSGVDAVAGIVQLDESAPMSLVRRFRSHYGVEADGTHTHVHGANIAMRASTYLDAGGWDARRTGEDHDLWRRLRIVGRCVSSTAIVVRTSARTFGRAPRGFAGDLRALCSSEVVA